MKRLLVLFSTVLLLAGCSTKTAEEYKQSAETNLKNNNVAQAIKDYEALVKEFPKNEFAADALYELATMYQNRMVKDLSPIQQQEKAAESFRLLQENFPRDERAPLALFMAAYIKANELKNFREATELYNTFLKKYPKHELASSASQELEIMGLSPDEVLKKKTAAGI